MSHQHYSRLPGVLLMIAALLMNEGAVGALLAADGTIDTPSTRLAVVLVQLCAIVAAILLALKPAWWSVFFRSDGLPTVLLAMVTLAGAALNVVAHRERSARQQTETRWSRMVASEELISQLGRELPKCTESILNLQLPHRASHALFARQVSVADVTGSSAEIAIDGMGLAKRAWQIEADPRIVDRDSLSLWQGLLADVDHFEHANFFVVEGRFPHSNPAEYETTIGFTGLARKFSGKWVDVRVTQQVAWRRENGEATGSGWEIYAWHVTDFQTLDTERIMFVEVQDTAIRDPVTAKKLRESRFEQRWREFLTRDHVLDKPDQDPAAVARIFSRTSPGLTVIDLDRDRLDDLLILNGDDSVLLRNRGDGTFDDITNSLGIPLNDATAALMADFDNDGDVDLLLGRNRLRSSYYVNEGGKLIDKSATIEGGPLPRLVSSLAAADFNRDGLLDVYISTYGYSPLSFEHMYPELRSGPYLLSKYLSPSDTRHLDRLVNAPEFNLVINAPGPPNALLQNVGAGKFEIVEMPPTLRVFRNSFHASWADYDEDGDPDLYISNDYAPNNLLKNEGQGTFVDATEETGTVDVGFGMGVSWGDYDHDGRQDLYVSNMYSKAGKRIVKQFPHVDARLHQLHRGNSLFRNLHTRFEQVSGTAPPALTVENAGWSWGAQFVDIDNDSWLDIYALSGWISLPPELDIPVDI